MNKLLSTICSVSEKLNPTTPKMRLLKVTDWAIIVANEVKVPDV